MKEVYALSHEANTAGYSKVVQPLMDFCTQILAKNPHLEHDIEVALMPLRHKVKILLKMQSSGDEKALGIVVKEAQERVNNIFNNTQNGRDYWRMYLE